MGAGGLSQAQEGPGPLPPPRPFRCPRLTSCFSSWLGQGAGGGDASPGREPPLPGSPPQALRGQVHHNDNNIADIMITRVTTPVQRELDDLPEGLVLGARGHRLTSAVTPGRREETRRVQEGTCALPQGVGHLATEAR